jgi:hypothetical protein
MASNNKGRTCDIGVERELGSCRLGGEATAPERNTHSTADIERYIDSGHPYLRLPTRFDVVQAGLTAQDVKPFVELESFL